MAFFAACVSVSLSLVSTFLLVPCFKYIARVTRLLDVPDGVLKNHKQPVPYLGGVAVFFGCLVPFFYFSPTVLFNQWHFFTGLLVLLLVGLLDDIYRISPAKKFAGQCIAWVFFREEGLIFDTHIFFEVLPFCLQSSFVISILNEMASLFWILTCMNAFNLIDIMDGLASSTALVSALFFMGVALFFNVSWVVVFLGCFCSRGALAASFDEMSRLTANPAACKSCTNSEKICVDCKSPTRADFSGFTNPLSSNHSAAFSKNSAKSCPQRNSSEIKAGA